jgi:hypothetical protein
MAVFQKFTEGAAVLGGNRRRKILADDASHPTDTYY